MGRTQSIPVIDAAMMLGEFGRIYFADFDQVRASRRTVCEFRSWASEGTGRFGFFPVYLLEVHTQDKSKLHRLEIGLRSLASGSAIF